MCATASMDGTIKVSLHWKLALISGFSGDYSMCATASMEGTIKQFKLALISGFSGDCSMCVTASMDITIKVRLHCKSTLFSG